jgi:hypothetical protein
MWDTLGEAVEGWYEEIRGVALLLRLWELYRDPKTDENDLYELVWIGGGAVSFKPEAMGEDGSEASPWMYQDFLTPFPKGDGDSDSYIRWGARLLLEGVLSFALASLTVPTFAAIPGGQISLVPNNLLGAIYVHFVQEVLGRADPLTRCAACGKWFVARHASRIYCTDACKMKAYRRSRSGKE